MKFFVHAKGLCESKRVGDRTRIWAFAHVMAGATIGSDCNICESVFIEDNVYIGNRVTVKNGVQLWSGIEIEDNVFVGPNVTFTNDNFPRSGLRPRKYAKTVIREGASIGANVTLLPGLTVGRGAMVGAGAVVTKDVPPNAIVWGNPARIQGYVSDQARGKSLASRDGGRSPVRFDGPLPGNARMLPFKKSSDMRGNLVAIEMSEELPFAPSRFFCVFGVPNRDVRGEHAHRECQQVLVALAGSLSVLLDDGISRCEIRLSAPSEGLFLPHHVWSTQFGYSEDAVLGVFASNPYDDGDYIRTYEDFLAEVQSIHMV